MPLTHWACPEGKATYGEVHTPEFCITECPDKCASPFLIAALTTSVQGNYHKGKYISATSFSGCKRKLYLERRVDYADIMKNSFYSYRGTVMHQVVEDAGTIEFEGITLGELGYMTEWKMLIGFCFVHAGFELHPDVDPYEEETWDKVSCPGCSTSRVPYKKREWILLGGTLDGLEPVWRDFDPDTGTLPCILWDLKTMQEYAVKYFIKGDPKNIFHRHVKDAHYCQAQVYKYLVERSTPPEALSKKGVKRLVLVESNIQAFSMGQFPRTGSTYRWKDHWRKPESTWDIPSITFKDDDWIENYIKTEGYPIYTSLILNETRPPICEPEGKKTGEQSWQCRFCAFEYSKYCPNAPVEWAALESGDSPDEAYTKAKGVPNEPE